MAGEQKSRYTLAEIDGLTLRAGCGLGTVNGGNRAAAESAPAVDAAGAPIRLLRRVFSFPAVLAALLVVLAVLTVRGRFDDPDMWWHLKMGQVIWTTHTIPLHDIFSYTTHQQASVPQEWLSQLFIYGAYRFGGFTGLMIWLCALSSALLLAGYWLCWLCGRNSKVAFVGAMTLWLFGTIGFSIRPQMVGYLLLVIELAVIHLGRTRSPRWFFALPFLFAIWINSHGSYILGVLVAGVMLVGSLFEFRAGSLAAEKWKAHTRRVFVLALVLSGAALFLNPDGIKQILYPLDTIMHQSIQMANVEEWRPTQMTDPRGLAMLAVLLCIFLRVIVRRSELRVDELLLLALGTWMAVSHERMLIVFGVLAAPILSRHLSSAWEAYDAAADRIWLNAVFLGASILVVVLAFPDSGNLQRQIEEKSPVKAVEFIKENHLAGPMLNDYGYGGYLIWAAPEYKDFIDGRGDVFEWSGVLGEFGRWATLQSDPTVLLQKYGVNFCLLSSQSPMIHVLPLTREWKIIYSDTNSVVLARADSAVKSN